MALVHSRKAGFRYRCAVLAFAAVLLLSLVGSAAASPAQQVSNCYDAVIIMYSPDQPSPGDTVYLNVGVDSTLAYQPGFQSRWLVNNQEISGNTLEPWDGCDSIVQYVYTCNGVETSKTMVIPGAGCARNSNWIPVAGGAAVVAAAAAAAARRRRAKGKQNPKEPEQYILQVSREAIETVAGRTEPLEVNVWRVTPQGGYEAVPNASIALTPSAAPAGLAVAPTNGAGALTCTVTVAPDSPGGEGAIRVTGVAGATTYTSTVRVSVTPLYQVQVVSHDPQNAVPAAPGELWAYARVTAGDPRPQPELDALTQQVKFTVTGSNAALVQMRDQQFNGGWQAVRLFRDPAQAVAPSQPQLVAEVMMGQSRLQAQLALTLETRLQLAAWVRGEKAADVTYSLERQRWELPDIILYFHDPADPARPLKPPFKYGFGTPPFTADHPILAMSEFFGHAADQFTLRLKPVAGEGLTRALSRAQGKGLSVRITIVAEDYQQGRYPADVTLRFVRQPVLQFKPTDLTLRPGHEERLVVTLCENRGDGAPQPLPDAQITLEPPTKQPSLTVNPVGGKSPLATELLLEEAKGATDFALVVRGETPGQPIVEALYSVKVALDYAVEFRYPEHLADPGTIGHVRSEISFPPDDAGVTAHAIALDLSQNPAAPDDAVTKELTLEVDGPNKQFIRAGGQTLTAGPCAQTLPLKFTWPDASAVFADDDPQIRASLELGKKTIRAAARLNLDDCRLAVLSKDLESYAARLEGEGYYVRNAFLGGGTGPALDKANQAYGIVWDWTAGWLWYRNKGMRCQDWLELTSAEVSRLVRRVYGDRAHLASISIDEKSSVTPEGAVDYLDSVYTINHILLKLTTPNKRTYSIDFWEHFRYGAGNPPVLQEWETTRQVWLRRLAGDVDPASFMHTEHIYLPAP